MYRWVSRAQPVPKAGEAGAEGGQPEKIMVLSFSVPISILPAASTDAAGDAMKVDSAAATTVPPPPRDTPRCDVQGCTGLRKYRLVRDFQKGACGLSHLKALEAQMV